MNQAGQDDAHMTAIKYFPRVETAWRYGTGLEKGFSVDSLTAGMPGASPCNARILVDKEKPVAACRSR